MTEFRTQTVAQLAHELTLAPARHRAQQVEGAVRAIELMRPDREYARSFLVFQITGYRSRQTDDIELSGADLIADVVLLIEKLTLLSPLPMPDEAGSICDAAELCRRWNISTRTLDRWRCLGVVARWFDAADGPALLFHEADVRRFEAAHVERIRRAATYRRIDEPERLALVQRTLDVMTRDGLGLCAAAQAVARQTGRAEETIRLSVRRAQSLAEEDAAPPDSEDVLRAAHRSGQSVASLARQLRLSQKEVRRRLLRARAEELFATPIKYVYAPEFDHPRAEQMIFADTPSSEPAEPADAVPQGLPPYLRDLCSAALLTAAQERDLFRRFNYLLHRADQARRLLDPAAATETAVDHVETLLARALAIKSRIIHANQRLVISIAKRHLGRVPGLDLPDLISEGNIALMRAVAAFDFARGNRFSTYATWSVARIFTHTVKIARGHNDHFQSGHEEPWAGVESTECPDPATEAGDTEIHTALRGMLDRLDPRQREIVERRFGLAGDAPETLAEVSEAMSLSRERIRQIESSTLRGLRAELERRGLTAVVV